MLSLAEKEWGAIRAFAEKSYPKECCGILAGKSGGDNKSVLFVIEMANAQDGSQETRYLISPDDLRREDKELRQHGLEILGFFHSHPDVPCRASETDLAQA